MTQETKVTRIRLEDRLAASNIDQDLIEWLNYERYRIDEDWAASRIEGGNAPRPRNIPDEIMQLIDRLASTEAADALLRECYEPMMLLAQSDKNPQTRKIAAMLAARIDTHLKGASHDNQD